MPKTGLGRAEWLNRLKAYAAGNFTFSTGQKPPTGTFWAKEIVKIDNCPGNAKQKKLSGEVARCTCTWHPARVPVAPPKPVIPPNTAVQPTSGVSHLVVPTQHPSSSAPRVAVSSQQQAFYVPPGTASTQHPSSSAPRVAVSSQQQAFYVPPGADSTQHPSSSASRVAVSSQRQAFYVPPGVGPTQHPSSSVPRVTVSGQQQAFYEPPVADPSQHPLSSQGTTLPTPAFPVGWHRNMGAADCEWVSKQVFTADKKLREPIQLWNHPPQPRLQSATPSPKTLFLKRLFLWMPRKAWKIDLLCPQCNKSLKPKGLYNRVRLVLDISSYYYMATEYLHCPGCKATIIGWDERVIQQVPTAMQSMFPAVLTHKYACDRTVVGMLRSRTLGNSPTALQHNIQELHSEQWLRLQLCYLSQCEAHKQCLQAQQLSAVVYEKAPDLAVLPMARWFLAAYVRDVWTRHDSILASLSSVFGSIIKMDSTKKLVRKLQGSAAGSAAWATSVGNERGEILQCVLTISESNAGLKEMAEGLMDRYERSRIPPPKVLYVDRDCCTQDQHSRCQTLFSKWGDLLIRLDIWHYMRRLSQTCISESHPLYGTLMQRLSRCIFEWDENDYERLIDATTADMVQEGIKAPLREHILKLITKEEMARHCRRQTRSVPEMRRNIEDLFLAMSTATDSLGVALMSPEMETIWNEQKRHLACIADPPGVQLYAVCHYIRKGGIQLPVYRCARGSTSLESFHLHLARFIPGTAANGVNFQAYLLDGVSRWNELRSDAALRSKTTGQPGFVPQVTPVNAVRSFDVTLKQRVNALSTSVHGTPLLPDFRPPRPKTDERFGIAYLFQQSGRSFPTTPDELETAIDEGFEEEYASDSEDESLDRSPETVTEATAMALPAEMTKDENGDEDEDDEKEYEEATDSKGIPGWEKVDRLAKYLLGLEAGLSVSNKAADEIIKLYNALSDFDKQPISYKARYKPAAEGRFGRRKRYRTTHTGAESMKRCFLSAGQPSLPPSNSRLVEAIVINLTLQHTAPVRRVNSDGKATYSSRFQQIVASYNAIRGRLFNSQRLLDGTNIALYPINEATVSNWYKNKIRVEQITSLLQGHSLPEPAVVAPKPLPPPIVSQSGPSSEQHHPEPVVGPSNAAPNLSPSTPPTSISCETPPLSSVPAVSDIPRTSDWRSRKKAYDSSVVANAPTAPKMPRKVYTCGVCKSPMSDGTHTQFKGRRYCPQATNGKTQREWLDEAKAVYAKKLAEKRTDGV